MKINSIMAPDVTYENIALGLQEFEADVLEILAHASYNKFTVGEIEALVKVISDAANKRLAIAISRSRVVSLSQEQVHV